MLVSHLSSVRFQRTVAAVLIKFHVLSHKRTVSHMTFNEIWIFFSSEWLKLWLMVWSLFLQEKTKAWTGYEDGKMNSRYSEQYEIFTFSHLDFYKYFYHHKLHFKKEPWFCPSFNLASGYFNFLHRLSDAMWKQLVGRCWGSNLMDYFN